MEAKLIIVKGKTNRAEVALKLPGTIGRSREADLTIAHPMISRQHCQLFEVDGLVKIRDLGSLNGTFIGEEQIKEADLPPHTEFCIGPLTFRVEYEYVGPTAEAPEFLAVPEPPPEGLLPFEPDFLPAAEESPAVAPSVELPAPVAPAGSPPPLPTSTSVPLVSFDAGAPDLSGWSAAVQRGQLDRPPEELRPAAPAPSAKASEPLAEEDESFIGEFLVDELSAETPPPPAASEPTITEAPQAESSVAAEPLAFTEPPVELPAIETPGEPPAAEVSAESAEESDEPLLAEPEPATQPEGSETSTSEAVEETLASQAEDEAAAKKSRWWPFGRGKNKAKEEADTAARPTAPAEPPSPPSFEPAPDFLAVSDSPQTQPDAPPLPDEGPSTDDDALNQFFKGLK
jgi:hypothetical protein